MQRRRFIEGAYYRLIEDCKVTSIHDRIRRRDKLDVRLQEDKIYTERHHVIPVSLGGSKTDRSNMIVVLPEEHLIIHLLRFKLFGHLEDGRAVFVMLNWKKTKRNLNKAYSLARRVGNKSYSGRNHPLYGSTRPDNVKIAISRARKGTMPAKDLATGAMIGSVPLDHKNVLNGTWVHHSKSRSPTPEARAKYKELTTLEKNSRWLGITDQQILALADEFYEMNGKWISDDWDRFLATKRIRLPKTFSKNRFAGLNFLDVLAARYGIKRAEMRSKSTTHKQNLAAAIKGRRWYHNDELQLSKQLRSPTTGWVLGRKKYA